MHDICSRGLVHVLLRMQAAFCTGQQTLLKQPETCRACSGSDDA